MRRVLAACWGTDAKVWIGRRVTLYCDERVTFGNDVTGGTRISHLSHIDGTKKIPLLVKRGKSATFTVEPLVEEAPTPTLTDAEIACCTDAAQLRQWWTAHPEHRAAIEQRKAELDGAQ